MWITTAKGRSAAVYSHRQIGYVILVVSVCTLAVPAILFLTTGLPWSLWIPLAVIVPISVFFGSLTTEVTQDRFTFWFGPGMIRRSFLLSAIEWCVPVRNPWYHGWGIHRTRAGWLYNVSGAEAVELKLRVGKTLRVGTDEPEELCRAIRMMQGMAQLGGGARRD